MAASRSKSRATTTPWIAAALREGRGMQVRAGPELAVQATLLRAAGMMGD
jgi:hypothetical protein